MLSDTNYSIISLALLLVLVFVHDYYNNYMIHFPKVFRSILYITCTFLATNAFEVHMFRICISDSGVME